MTALLFAANSGSVEGGVLHIGQRIHIRYRVLRSLRFRADSVVGISTQFYRLPGR